MSTFTQLRKRREQYKAQGLCPACGKLPEIDRVYCSFHLRYFREYRRKRRVAKRCIQCNQSAKKSLCEKCRDKGNALRRSRYASLKRHSICVACKIEKARPGKVCCADCAANEYERWLKWASNNL